MNKPGIGTIGGGSNRRITGLYAPHLVGQLMYMLNSRDAEFHRLRESARLQMDKCIADLESAFKIMSYGINSLEDKSQRLAILRTSQELTIKKEYIKTLRNELDNPSEDMVKMTIQSFEESTGQRVTPVTTTVTY